jgi:hypothetical protein
MILNHLNAEGLNPHMWKEKIMVSSAVMCVVIRAENFQASNQASQAQSASTQ